MQGSVKSVPLADVHSTLEEHADHLGLHLRNTKYIAPKVTLTDADIKTHTIVGIVLSTCGFQMLRHTAITLAGNL